MSSGSISRCTQLGIIMHTTCPGQGAYGSLGQLHQDCPHTHTHISLLKLQSRHSAHMWGMTHCLISAPSKLQSDVHPLAGVGFAAVCLQGNACGGGITDHRHQLVAILKFILFMNVDLHSICYTILTDANS